MSFPAVVTLDWAAQCGCGWDELSYTHHGARVAAGLHRRATGHSAVEFVPALYARRAEGSR